MISVICPFCKQEHISIKNWEGQIFACQARWHQELKDRILYKSFHETKLNFIFVDLLKNEIFITLDGRQVHHQNYKFNIDINLLLTQILKLYASKS